MPTVVDTDGTAETILKNHKYSSNITKVIPSRVYLYIINLWNFFVCLSANPILRHTSALFYGL